MTAFYIAGAALVVIALIVSFIGMRQDNFPSPTVLRIGTALVAVVVIGTCVLAVRASQHEAGEREHEENIEAAEASEAETETNQDIDEAEDEAPTDASESGAGVQGSTGGDGEQVFIDQDCGGCHSLQATQSTGQIGPNLDTELVNEDEEFIRTSIVDPGADVAEGFSDGIMPTNFGELPPEDLDALVAFIYDVTRQDSK